MDGNSFADSFLKESVEKFIRKASRSCLESVIVGNQESEEEFARYIESSLPPYLENSKTELIRSMRRETASIQEKISEINREMATFKLETAKVSNQYTLDNNELRRNLAQISGKLARRKDKAAIQASRLRNNVSFEKKRTDEIRSIVSRLKGFANSADSVRISALFRHFFDDSDSELYHLKVRLRDELTRQKAVNLKELKSKLSSLREENGRICKAGDRALRKMGSEERSFALATMDFDRLVEASYRKCESEAVSEEVGDIIEDKESLLSKPGRLRKGIEKYMRSKLAEDENGWKERLSSSQSEERDLIRRVAINKVGSSGGENRIKTFGDREWEAEKTKIDRTMAEIKDLRDSLPSFLSTGRN